MRGGKYINTFISRVFSAEFVSGDDLKYWERMSL